jgi:hypothetical protein
LVLAALAASSCRSISDLDIEYSECVAPPVPYLEEFEGDGVTSTRQYLEDRCWHIEDAQVTHDDSDIKLEPALDDLPSVRWDADPPRVLRRVQGDFVLIAQTEASLALNDNFCDLAETPGGEGDRAGILVRSIDPGGESLAAVMVSPFYPPGVDPADACQDEAEPGPTAQATAFSEERFAAYDDIGEDGEAEIAVCRKDTTLAFFTFDRLEARWRALQTRGERAEGGAAGASAVGEGGQGGSGRESVQFVVEIGEAPVDVGLAMTLSASGSDNQVQGTFNWVALQAEGNIGECPTVLDEFSVPTAK